MSFSYAAGSSTPGYGGLAEFTNLRIGATGTFKPIDIPPLSQAAPLRFQVTPVPRGGGHMSTPTLDAWQFDIVGSLDGLAPADVQAAKDYLMSKVNVAKGAMNLTLNALGWAATRTMTVRLAGQVSVTEPDVDHKKSRVRTFTIPLLAEDPIQYSSTSADTVITTATAVTNAGTADVPYLVRFDGANTDHIQIDRVGGTDATVLLQYALASGKYAIINTRDGSYITNSGVDLAPYIAVGSGARFLSPSGNSFTKSSGSGGTATVTHYDGYA